MEVLILDTNFESVAIIDSFESLIWTDRFYECGDFEIYTGMREDILDIIKPDYYLWNSDSDRVMIIEDYLIETDVEEGKHITVTGRSLESILDRRVLWGNVTLSGNLQDEIERLLNECIISPEVAERKIDNFIFKKSDDPVITNLTISAQYTGDNLLDVVQKICESEKIGFKVILTDNNEFEFSLYAGIDRSYKQDINPYVVFSPTYDNIINSSYFESKKTLKNVAYIAGETVNNVMKHLVVGTESGLNRRELYTDARDISSTDGDVTLSPTEYNAQLEQRGKEDLVKQVYSKTFEGQADASRMYVYGEHFFIGDIVQIANEYGIEGRAYISELILSQSKDGIEIYPTFSTVDEEII